MKLATFDAIQSGIVQGIFAIAAGGAAYATARLIGSGLGADLETVSNTALLANAAVTGVLSEKFYRENQATHSGSPVAHCVSATAAPILGFAALHGLL